MRFNRPKSNRGKLSHRLAFFAFTVPLLLPLSSHGQPFLVPNTGDLVAGFRKTGANQANYEAVVNIGNITNFEAIAPGTQVTIGHYTPSPQLVPDSFPDFNNLQWSVFGDNTSSARVWAGFPRTTMWLTLPRSDSNTQTPVPGRFIPFGQNSIWNYVAGVGVGASFISSGEISNQDNTATFVREPSGDTTHALSVYIGDPSDPTVGDFSGYLPFDVENLTPASFTSATRSDLYQFCPIATVDPNTQLTNGPAYYVGYFQFNPDGTMSFTRATTNSIVIPQPQIVGVTRAGNTTTISFSTTSGATYSLLYTSATGLTLPVSGWSTLSATVTGDGTTRSLTDTTTDAVRYYRVSAH